MSESIQQEKKPVLRLASASPRRRQLLDLIGVPHLITPADIDETPHASEAADEYVMRLAREKAEAIWALHQDLPVLGKPESAADAAPRLRKLSGREHLVHTGVALRTGPSVKVGISTTQVWFAPLTPEQIHAYWASGEPQGKAGAYAIQGLGAVFVSNIAGSYTGVMGLPLFETAQMLRDAGIPVWRGRLYV